MKKYILFIACFVAAIGLMLQGCSSSENQLLESVPLGQRCLVAVVNADRIMELTGSEIRSDGTIKSSETMERLSDHLLLNESDSAEMRIILGMLPYLDSKCLLYYVAQDRESFITANIKQVEQAEKYLKQKSHAAMRVLDDIRFYNFGPVVVAVRDNQCWLFNGTARRLTGILDEASKNNAAGLNGVREFLSNPEMAKCALMSNVTADLTGARNIWHCIDITADRTNGVAKAVSMYGDGEEVKSDFLDVMDTDFLRYFPADLNLVVAFGHRSGEINDAMLEPFSEVTNSSIGSYIRVLKPYLEALDGTFAFGMKIPEKTDSVRSLPEVILMARMKQEKVNSTINDISSMVQAFGGNVVTDGNNGMVKVSVPGYPQTLYIANCDGNLTIATFLPDGKCQNSFAPLFEGKQGGGFINIGNLGLADPNCSFGMKGEIQISDSEFDYSLSFPGSNHDFVTSLAVVTDAFLK